MERIVCILGIFLLGLFHSPLSHAQRQFWNAGKGGAGTWNATSTNWENDKGETGVWLGGEAFFNKPGGEVMLESTAQNPLYFETLSFASGGYSFKDGYLAIKNLNDNNNGYIDIPKDNDVEIASVFMDGGPINALIKKGNGRLILSGSNLHTGGTYVDAGELMVGKNENFGDVSSPVIVDNANLTISGDNWNPVDRIFHFTGKTCTLTVANAANILEAISLFDIKTSFYKDGPGELIIPIKSKYSGNITILNGKLLFKNTEWEWVDILPVNIKGGTFSLSPDKEKGIKLENISGNGTLEKEGEGILLLEGSNTAGGNFVNKEGIVQLNSDWQGDFEQMSGARLILSPDKSIYGKALLRDTIVQSGKNSWLDDVELNRAVFKLTLNSEIEIRGDLNLTDMNTIVLDKEPELPISLMKVSGYHPTDDETTNRLQVKVGKKLISNNPDYIFTWYENELFLRDKNKPFPLEYKVEIKPEEGITLGNMKPGTYTYKHNEYFYLTFFTDDPAIQKEAIRFLVNGKEASFRGIGGNQNYTYSVNGMTEDQTIEIGFKVFILTTTIPKGVALSPDTKTEFAYGDTFTFTLTLEDDYSESDMRVFVNGKRQTPANHEGNSYTFIIESITEDLNLRVLGVEPNDPVSNIQPETSHYPVFSSDNGLLSVELDKPADVTVYGLTGQVSARVKASQTHLNVPLTQGIYLVRVGEKVYKVVVR